MITVFILFVSPVEIFSQNEIMNNTQQEFIKRGAQKDPLTNFIMLNVEANGHQDSIIIYFNEFGSEGYDNEYDIYDFSAPSGDHPNFYSIIPTNIRLYKNCLPEDVIDDYTVDLGLEIYTQGTYTISVNAINITDPVHVYLLDMSDYSITNLQVTNNYQFNFSAGVSNDRFKLIFEINSAPILYTSVDDQFIDEDQYYDYQIPSDLFVDLDYNDNLSYSVCLSNGDVLPEHIAYNPFNHTISGTPENSDVGILSIRILAFDIFNDSSYCDYYLEVYNVNDVPMINKEISDQEILAGEYFYFQLPDSTFIDIDANDILTYTAYDLPEWLDFDSEAQVFSGTPGINDVSNSTISVKAEDIEGLFAIGEFSLSVAGSSDIPAFAKSAISLGPNPTESVVRIRFDHLPNFEFSKLEIYNSGGMMVYKTAIETRELSVKLSDFSNGFYYFKFIAEENSITKVVVKRDN